MSVGLFDSSVLLNVGDTGVCVAFQFQLLPTALFKSSSDFIPLGKTLITLNVLDKDTG